MEKLRLDRLLASTGAWSRREVKLLVRQGRVLADGSPVASAEEKFDPSAVVLTVDGAPILWERYTYVMLHKPAGYLSATSDGRGQTVLDLLPPDLRRRNLFPVGRLDKDTEGLLLLTNDGPLAHALLAPGKHVDKVYFVRTAGCLTEEDCKAFAAGLLLGDGLQCMPAGLESLQAEMEESQALVTLREGKFHQIKRMLAARGKPVRYLKRLQMGNLTLDSQLLPGQYRFLREEEVEALKNPGK